ncbi:MAG: ammonium transporter [Prevotella sp.]|nr:ammonium transporter [Prevotella sp.]
MKNGFFKYIAFSGLLLLLCPALVIAQDDTAKTVVVETAAAAEEIVPGASCAVPETVEEITEATLNSGNTAWLIVATILVMMMTIPGLALFYGGLVRQKNILSILMQCLIITAVISIEWIIVGYTWVFGTGFMPDENGGGGSVLGAFIGGFDKIFLHGITLNSLTGDIPELVFVLFQCMFAVITPALIIGAFAERIKFSGFLLFTILWALLVYNPMAHWVWGGGWMQQMGAIDFAGGTVVHINAGISALMMALLLGRRKGYLTTGHPITPHNIPFVVIGTALLWLGWFGFNAGSGLAANGQAANAFLVTHLATAVAAVTWTVLEWIINKKPTVVGICTGAVAGLVAITPAAGTVDAMGAFFIGLATGTVCYVMVAYVKPKLTYDDSLDAFGVHGVGGFIGAILTGVFATQFVTADYNNEIGALYGNWEQLWIQVKVNFAAVAYSAILTFILFKTVDKVIGLRVSKEEESVGLDISQHGEIAYSEDE